MPRVGTHAIGCAANQAASRSFFILARDRAVAAITVPMRAASKNTLNMAAILGWATPGPLARFLETTSSSKAAGDPLRCQRCVTISP